MKVFYDKECILYNFFSCFRSFFSISADPLNDAQLNRSYDDSLKWLKKQIIPNSVVDNPSPDRRKMILSYVIPEDDPAYKYLAKRSFLYDDAVAAVAFTMAGKYREAESLLNTLSRLVRDDGSMWFSYNTHNSWPDEIDHEGAMIRSGALAWAGYSFSHYVSVRNIEDKMFYKNDVCRKKIYRSSKKNCSVFDQSSGRG